MIWAVKYGVLPEVCASHISLRSCELQPGILHKLQLRWVLVYVWILCETRSCLSYVPWGVVTDVVIGVGSILRRYIAPGDSASNLSGLVKDLLSKKTKENITLRFRVSSKYALSLSCRWLSSCHPIICHEHLQREGMQMAMYRRVDRQERKQRHRDRKMEAVQWCVQTNKQGWKQRHRDREMEGDHSPFYR